VHCVESRVGRELGRVTIISRNEGTLADLATYFETSGVRARAAVAMELRAIDASARAVVLFPDDFEASAASLFLTKLRRARPSLLVIVVTREPQRVRGQSFATAGRSLPLVVLPRPSFGWSIVDVIRGHEGPR